MARLEVFTLLQSLDESDEIAFQAHWAHPVRQAKKLPYRLYTWLRAHPEAWQNQESPAHTSDLFAQLYPALYPGEPYKPQRIRRVLMEFKEVLEDFLAERSPHQIDAYLNRELRLLQYFLSKGLNHLFFSRLEALESYLDNQAKLTPETFLARFWMEEKRNEYLIQHNEPRDTFEALNDALDNFYLSRKLENFAAMRVRDRANQQAHTYTLEEELLAMLDNPALKPQGLPQLWQAVYQMLIGPNTGQAYHRARRILADLQARLPAITLRQVHGYLFNYLGALPDSGSRTYYERLWEMLRQMLNAGTLHMPDGRMTPPFFLQTLRTACFAGQYIWAAGFVNQVKTDLPKDATEELLDYADLLTAFYAGEVARAWQGSLVFRPRDLRLEAYLRILQVQLAYALGKEEEFERMVESLEKFIRRSISLGVRFVELVLEFARMAGRIGHARFGGGRLPKALVEQVHTRDAAEKLWLIAQVESLQGV